MASKTVPARRLVAEFAVIVVGVFVALTADAAWDSREEGVRLDDYLERFQVDLQASREDLREAIRRDSVVRASALSFELGLNAVPRASAEDLDEWLGGVSFPSLYAPRVGTFQAMIQSGDLYLIEDSAIHSAILAYLSEVDRFDRLYPEHKVVALESFGRLGGYINFQTRVGPDRDQADWGDLARIPGVTSEIRLIGISAAVRLALLRPLSERHDELLALLAAR